MNDFIIRRLAPHCHHFGLWLLLALLAGCGNRQVTPQNAVDIHKDDVCAVCGMYIDASPGPRGEAYVVGRTQPLKFDSTRDFFAYILQPENSARLQGLFVQDSARIDWEHPSNAATTFINARKAWYAAWQPRPGSMGPTLAPYATHTAAEDAVRLHGGEVLRFDDITTGLIAALDYRCPVRDSSRHRATMQCRATSSSDSLPQRKAPDMPGMSTMEGAPVPTGENE